MRRLSCQLVSSAVALRFAAEKAPAKEDEVRKYDLFGYEVDTNTAPWVEKIKKCKYYDEAGEVLVNMNLKNCPPDLAAYNATLQKIFEAPSKEATPVKNESKFCAMMDLMEEIRYRNKIIPNEESWTWVLKECVQSGEFRLGYCVSQLMEAELKKPAPAELVKQNEANAAKAKAEGKEFPSYLSQQESLLETKIM